MSRQLSLAQRKHLDGDFESAEALYRQIIHDNAYDAQARHYLGYLLQQTDRLAESKAELIAAIALDDSHAEWHFNLGITLMKQGLAVEAVDAFARALNLDPGRYFYWTNLGTAFESAQDLAGAEQCYLRAVDVDPACPDAYYLLSALYLKLERFDEARHFNYRGIVAVPAGKSKIVLSNACYELGRIDEAIAILEHWLAQEPDNAVAMHLLTAYRSEPAPERCSTQYVEKTFDEFADSFDSTLNKLKYSGPQLVKDHLASLGLPAASLRVLDLGCGTGMAGESLAPYARELTGVDLSQAMLEKAAARQIYQHLHKADITDFLGSCSERFDLVTCMDTFIYLGRLDEILVLIHQALKPGGLLLFSTETLHDPQGQAYRLNISGRYSHAHEYLVSTLSQAGFKINKMDEVTIRTESGCPIAGQFFSASVEG